MLTTGGRNWQLIDHNYLSLLLFDSKVFQMWHSLQMTNVERVILIFGSEKLNKYF
jgi:hypothetical protein